jgi:hypothetical protein
MIEPKALPVPVLTSSWLGNYITWFKSHERWILLSTVGFFGIHFYNKFADLSLKRDQTQAQIAGNKLETDQEANIQLVSQMNDLKKVFSEQTAQLQAQIVARDASTKKQISTDNSMTDPQLAARWAELIKVKPEEVTSSPVPNTLQVSDNAAHATVDALEDLPTCKADLAAVQDQLIGSAKLGVDQANVIASDVVVLADEKKKHEDDVKELKEQNRKSFWHGFKWGVITGFIGKIFIDKGI